MGVKMEERSMACARPSLFLTCRLASIVQKFKTRLQEKVSQRKRTLNPFGASYHRGTRLRALSDLEKVSLPRRRQSVTDNPKSDLRHEEHAAYISLLIHDLDHHTKPTALPLTKIAADDNLLFCHGHETLVKTRTERLSLQHVAYVFDLSTFLIHKLEAIWSDNGCASQEWASYNDDCQRLKDEKYVANLLHFLRRLQHFLFQILVHRSIKRLDEVHDDWQKHDSRQEGKALDDDWFSEWPSGQRPLSTTWPWNIRPSLVVLWGVCWMFYNPTQQGNNDSTARVPAQNILDSSAFNEMWGPSFPQTEDFDEAANVHAPNALLTYTQADHNAASLAQAAIFHEQGANSSRRSSGNAAPHLQISTSPSLDGRVYTPPRLAGTTQSPQRLGLAASNPRGHVDPTAYNNTHYSPAFANTPAVSRDFDWPAVASGGDFATYAAFAHPAPNAFGPAYNRPPSQAPYFSYPNPVSGVPVLAVSPVAGGPSFAPNIDSPTPHPRYNQIRRTSSNYQSSIMGAGENPPYPMSPPSERHRSTSIATSASPGASVVPSPIMSQSPQTSETSARQRLAQPRTQEPPRNAQGEITCDHEECSEEPPIFRRRCEWNKHMDKHERPYKCLEPGCDKVQGFTYSGGLLRHQREVHKKNVSTRAPLYCPHPTCNRSTGTGFTRKENLNEHLRRRHNVGPDTFNQTSPLATTPALVPAASSNPTDSSRKRKRTMEPKPEPEDEPDFDDSGIADTEDLREQIKRLRSENEDLRGRLDQQTETNRQLQLALTNLNNMVGNRTHTAPQNR